jgi:hypothetical protein
VISERCPEGATVKVVDETRYLHVGGNDYPLDEALRLGWLDEISQPVDADHFDDEWDIEILVGEEPFPLNGAAASLHKLPFYVSVKILKGSETVLEARRIKSSDFSMNLGLLKELLEVLNGLAGLDSERSEDA